MSSRWDWPNGVDHWFEISCDHDTCGTLSSCLKLPDAFATAIEEHGACRPCVALVVRRGREAKKKRSTWRIWLHTGPHEADAEAA